MVFEFKLPDLGEGITEGDVVSGGETLVTLELEEKEVPEKEKRPPSVSVVGTVPEAEEVLATPLVRNLAKRLGVDLKKVTGTGPGGRVSEEDVKGAGEGGRKEAKDKYGSIERVAIKGVRKSIAKNLMLAQKNAAFVTGMDDCDITELWKLRIKEKGEAQKRGVHLTFLPFFMKASQHALREHPMLNASVDEETGDVIVKKYYNIGVAVDTPEGLMVPVVKDVDKKTVLELAGEVEELGKKARDRKITLEELKGSTFTISNFGTFGGVYATPIINYPDVAILGTGTIRERPWAVDGKIVLRVILPISFTFDHRVVDGKEAALFMNKVIKYLEDPGLLF